MSKSLHVPALEVRQGQHLLYCFAVEGKLVGQFAALSRLGRGEDGNLLGYQRPELLQHVRQIRTYLESADALLPNALVVAFDRRVQFLPQGPAVESSRAGRLIIPLGGSDNAKVGWLVDGQQRAAAMREANIESFPVCVIGFLAESVEEQRDQFILVNSTKPLPRSLLHELLPQSGPSLPLSLRKYQLPAQLLERLNRDEDSPLMGLIRTPTCPDGVIKDTSVLKMLANSLSNGGLFFYLDREDHDHDIEGMLRLLKDFWSAVASVFEDAWARPARESRLSGGPGVVALGFVMDAIIDRHRQRCLPGREQFRVDLIPLQSVCRWTGGIWELGPDHKRKWNDLQNTPKDVRLLSDYLTLKYKVLVWNAGKED